MDKLDQQTWEETIDRLQSTTSQELREHFAHMIMLLAQCYIKDSECKAVVLVDTGAAMLTFAAGADEMDMASMVMQAHEAAQAITMRDAPPKEMFN
jgi:hypothetical protein